MQDKSAESSTSKPIRVGDFTLNFFSTRPTEKSEMPYSMLMQHIRELAALASIKENISLFFNINVDNIEYSYTDSFDDGENRPSPNKIHLRFTNTSELERARIIEILNDNNIPIQVLASNRKLAIFIFDNTGIYNFLKLVTPQQLDESKTDGLNP